VGILGTNCSSAAVTAAPVMSQAGLVMISSANTSPSLTSVGGVQGENWQPGYLRTSWNDSVMGRAAAFFAYQRLGVTQAAVINAGDAYSKGLTNVFAQAFQKLGGQLVREITIDETDVNQRPTLEAVALSGAQLVFFSLSQPLAGSRIVRQARNLANLQSLIFIGGEGMLSDVFIKDVGAAGVGVYLLGPAAIEGVDNDKFREAYQARYGAAPQSFYYSFATDATNLLLDSLEKVAVRQEDGTLNIGRQALRDALYATTDFNGLTGRLKCDAYGDCGVAKLNIVQFDNPGMSVEALSANVVFTYTAAASASPQ
jgi:branched-chain amino acid transport system substrate-binding protein